VSYCYLRSVGGTPISDKVTPDLASQMDAVDEEGLLDVVVELYTPTQRSAVPAGDRQAAMTQMKEAFQAAADPVIQLILSYGGEVRGEAWINQTVRARVPAKLIEQLTAADSVTAVDVHRQIEPEGA
jgi:hypothetical protein